MKKKWRATFYRDEEKTIKVQSCIVWETSEQAAISFCVSYFHLENALKISVEEVI